jgi:hypothetical protein
MKTKIHTIVTHRRPHLDEIVAIVLLMNYGEHKFPGIKDAKIIFWNAGTATPDGRDWNAWYEKGYVLVGVGGSPYDEHILPPGDQKECAATLVAKDLGIDQLPQLEQLLRITHTNDTTGGNHPMNLAAIISLGNKLFFDRNEESAQNIVQWAMEPIKWIIANQVRFFEECKPEFEQYADVFTTSFNGRPITGVAIQSDMEGVGAYARSKHGANANLVITQNSKHQVYISTEKRARICLDGVMKAIRIAELRKAGKQVDTKDSALTAEGTYPGVPHWYYHRDAGQILNGSLTAPDVPGTRLPLKDIVTMTIKALEHTTIQRVRNEVKKVA